MNVAQKGCETLLNGLYKVMVGKKHKYIHRLSFLQVKVVAFVGFYDIRFHTCHMRLHDY